MNTKFCTSCQVTRPVEGGAIRKCNRTSRWLCRWCVEKKSASPYQSKTGEAYNVARLMDYLHRTAA